MYACQIEGKTVVRGVAQCSALGDWRKLVKTVRLGETTMGGERFTVVRFDTKSGTERDAINSPAGAWMVSAEEAAYLNLQTRIPSGLYTASAPT